MLVARAALPPTLQDLLTARYLRLLQHPVGAFRRALIANGTCAGWTPRVPVRLYAARGDTTVTQVSAENCQDAIRARGGRVSLVQLGAVSHDVSDFLALPMIVRWFQTFRLSKQCNARIAMYPIPAAPFAGPAPAQQIGHAPYRRRPREQ